MISDEFFGWILSGWVFSIYSGDHEMQFRLLLLLLYELLLLEVGVVGSCYCDDEPQQLISIPKRIFFCLHDVYPNFRIFNW
jgi:hypothetical protein